MTQLAPALVTPATLPPVLLLLDVSDDHAVHHAAHQRAEPSNGRITADPTPHTNSLAYLALDLLRAMGRDSFARPDAERMSTDAAWRAVICWTLTTGLEEAIVLRAHRLTPERLGRLAAWRADTGIRLILIAHTPTGPAEHRLHTRLAATGLTDLRTVSGTSAILDAIGPPALGRRPGPPPPAHVHPLPGLPRGDGAAFRDACRRRLNEADFARTDGQYRAGFAAARIWLARHPASAAKPPARDTGPEEPGDWQDMEGLCLFLARLTVSSPSTQHTLARVRGAQAGFLSRQLQLDVPDDLAERAGPGITTVPITPRVAHTLITNLPNPLRAAAAAALLFTGTAHSLLSITQITSVDEHATRLAIDRDSRIYIGMPPGPQHMYAIPHRARPLLAAALAFRRRTPRTAGHFGLFAGCFGTSVRFGHLIRDAGLDIPAVTHPHPAEDWHTAARCRHVNVPVPAAPVL
ncbi:MULTISPECIES: hypothetical protein [unclassified Streptomyces]|uniref:hypothetical protein n=1 Tax=unclassified Streptomyces TaxID=2593676 RepID=UPI000DAE5E7F|nr:MULTISPECIES: hypothetical protein [unclassified Streptomyces]PZT71605.1 hypothetical protein DNK55_31030 [Streptomyces sp. AC1-42T]PZT73268.1 hypothetical protein DNK56_34045 [Streptomyces sp. AC1-42W]